MNPDILRITHREANVKSKVLKGTQSGLRGIWYVPCNGGVVWDLQRGVWYRTCNLQKFSEASRKKLRSVQIKSTRESCIFEYLNILYASSIIRTLSSPFRNSKRHTHK